MAKKQAIKIAEPEDESQDIPDEKPAHDIEDNEPETNGKSEFSKTDLIREAVEAGHPKPADGVAYIKEKHGLDIDPKYFSIVKGKMGKTGDKPASTSSAAVPRKPAATPASDGSTAAVPANLFEDLKQLRQIKDRYGDDFQKIVDAIG